MVSRWLISKQITMASGSRSLQLSGLDVSKNSNRYCLVPLLISKMYGWSMSRSRGIGLTFSPALSRLEGGPGMR